MRVAGCDPGTSSLDVLVLDGGAVADQSRFLPEQLRADPEAPVRWLRDRGPLDLVAGPSGYGLPLVRAADCTDAQLELMALVRPDERGHAGGVAGFSAVARAFRDSGLPVVFLPGVVHLSTVPAHRKLNRIDMGTPDKLCVAALALWEQDRYGAHDRYGIIEAGSAFTAVLVAGGNTIIDGLGGTAGPPGPLSCGGWDGEVAYLLSPLRKADLFRGGMADAPDPATGRAAFQEAIRKSVGGMLATHDCWHLCLSGRLLETDYALVREAVEALPGKLRFGSIKGLPGAWVKPAAQGAALIADGLAGGPFAPFVEQLRLREASGTVLDWLTHPRAAEVRGWFGLPPG